MTGSPVSVVSSAVYARLRTDTNGLAAWALGRMLDEARELGPNRVLIICEAGNVASARTIERHGGDLENVRDSGHGTVRC